jgi:hypothetical protein
MIIYMIDLDQRPVSNQRPFLKSMSTDVIYPKSQSDLTAFFPNSQICGRTGSFNTVHLLNLRNPTLIRGHHGHDRMKVGFITTYAISAYHH